MKKFTISILTALLLTPVVADEYTIEVKSAWDLLGALKDIKDMSIFNRDCVSQVWIYSDAKGWANYDNIDEIKAGRGFWVKGNEECSIKVEGLTTNSYEIKFGETINIDNGKLIVKFEDITDSRCPEGAMCITAGDVDLQLGITGILEIYEMQSFKLGESKTNAQSYSITLSDVKPFPSLSEDLNKSSYIATINIIKP